MKAIFVNDGVIDRIRSTRLVLPGVVRLFETFAHTLGYTAHDFSMEPVVRPHRVIWGHDVPFS